MDDLDGYFFGGCTGGQCFVSTECLSRMSIIRWRGSCYNFHGVIPPLLKKKNLKSCGVSKVKNFFNVTIKMLDCWSECSLSLSEAFQSIFFFCNKFIVLWLLLEQSHSFESNPEQRPFVVVFKSAPQSFIMVPPCFLSSVHKAQTCQVSEPMRVQVCLTHFRCPLTQRLSSKFWETWSKLPRVDNS